MMRRTLTIGFALALMMMPRAFAAESGISIEGAWARPTLGAGGASAAYFTIRNKTASADTLVSVATPAAKMAELHETRTQNGIAKMISLQNVEVPAGGSVAFAPGGKHVMLMGLTAPLKAGDRIRLTLTFKTAGARGLDVPVLNAAPESMDGMDMPH